MFAYWRNIFSWRNLESQGIEITKDNVGKYSNLTGYNLSLGTIIYLNDKNELHRLDGPAIKDVGGNKWWYQNGKLHRLNGPAVEFADGEKDYWINDHRLTEEEFNRRRNSSLKLSWKKSQGIEITNDNIKKYQRLTGYGFLVSGDIIYLNDNNELHRIDGPAIICKDGGEYWFENGKLI